MAGGAPPSDTGALVPTPLTPGTDGTDSDLDAVDQALGRVREALDREHESIKDAAEELGWKAAADIGSSVVVPGEVIGRQPPGDSEGLFATTPDNSATSTDHTGAELVLSNPLRFVGAATRRISHGIDLDEIVLGLCRATVPAFSDAVLVYLRDPLPVGDERPVGPVVLRLRRTERSARIDQANSPAMPSHSAYPPSYVLADGYSELVEVRPTASLAEVLRNVRRILGSSPHEQSALEGLLGRENPFPRGRRAILAPLRGRRRVIGAAVFLRTLNRDAFEEDDLLVAAQLATHTALGIDKAVLYGREAYIADELQRTMLPDSLPQPTGVRLASRYLPAA
ncbi:hypothetical protein OV450_8501, partial [Actinobacteria bacterium OV450]